MAIERLQVYKCSVCGNEVEVLFAGGGTLSLKEALDAAHGHEHAADGSELPSPSTNAAPPGTAAGNARAREWFWMAVSGILFVLLVIVAARARRGGAC